MAVYEGLNKVLVIGSGPITIGQSVELDYAGIHAVMSLKQENIAVVVLNSNAASVMTDRSIADSVYIEPVTLLNIKKIIEIEKPDGIIASPAGALGFSLAMRLFETGFLADNSVRFLDEPKSVFKKFDDKAAMLAMLYKLQIPVPQSFSAFSSDIAIEKAGKFGYPVLVRPSVIRDGVGTMIVADDNELEEFLQLCPELSEKHPVLIDKYIVGKELELDGISDGQDVLVVGITEHIEGTGVHSYDSITVYPTQSIKPRMLQTITDYGIRIARELKLLGVFNIQFAIENERIYVLDVNISASRTMPVLSKVTGIPMFNIATKVKIGIKLRELGLKTGLHKIPVDFVAVKAPVFSFALQRNLDIYLGPQVKSTGEVLGIDKTYRTALNKAFIACGIGIPQKNTGVLFSVGAPDYEGSFHAAMQLLKFGMNIYATPRTGAYFAGRGLDVEIVQYDDMLEVLHNDLITLVVNTPTKGEEYAKRGLMLRRYSLEFNLPIITSIDTVNALTFAMWDENLTPMLKPINEF